MMYSIEVLITNRKNVRDPEGETIHKNLVLKHGYKNIVNVRAGKYLLFSVEAQNAENALELVKNLCLKLRIYNPIVHDIEVRLHD